MSVCYLDTSAVLKRYLSEPLSAEFDAFALAGGHEFMISALVITEITSALARRVRNRDVDPGFADVARQRFQDDLMFCHWGLIEFQASMFSHAATLISTLPLPLSTLDALHLACALDAPADALATADKQLAVAADHAGLQVFPFF